MLEAVSVRYATLLPMMQIIIGRSVKIKGKNKFQITFIDILFHKIIVFKVFLDSIFFINMLMNFIS